MRRSEQRPTARRSRSGRAASRGTRAGLGARAPAAGHPPGEESDGRRRRELAVGVLWSDLTQVKADVLVVGHYLGVLPQAAELAVDLMVSGCERTHAERLVLTKLTSRGALRGDLGEILFFPTMDRRIAAVAGMGRLGTFRAPQLERLGRTVGQVVGMLPGLGTVGTVLIGSGKGNLGIPEAVDAYLDGLLEALSCDEALRLGRLVFVESHLDRALEILAAVRGYAAARTTAARDGTAMRLRVAEEIEEGEGGRISEDFGCAMVLAALSRSGSSPSGSKGRAVLDAVLAQLPREAQEGVRARLRAQRGGKDAVAARALRDLAMEFRLREPGTANGDVAIPTRVAFWRVDGDVHAAAITNTTTVTERGIPNRAWLIDRACERLHNPEPARIEEWSRSLRNLLVPQELAEVLWNEGPLVVEVDRELARVPWELLPGRDLRPLASSRPITRQLRTAYSPRPIETDSERPLRALVVADPMRSDLVPNPLREEAELVAALLREADIETVLLIGPPEPGTGAHVTGADGAADYLAVVDHLLAGRFDLVHYCGHATFDEEVPDRAGWVFEGPRLLTAHELAGMERAPRCVVANACLSARVARPAQGAAAARREADLVASLADEFFRHGVYDYVGTAWEVDSDSAKLFAQAFYGALLGGQPGAPIGTALRDAREKLFARRERSNAWAAYQHYGDPTRRLR